MSTELFSPLTLPHGPAWSNRVLLAPLTNQQSNRDGSASAADVEWFERMATGGYSMVMTAAAHVEAVGQAFPGQLGIFDDRHVDGLSSLAAIARRHGRTSSVQLHHGGMRALGGRLGRPVAPSETPHSTARALSSGGVESLRDSFIAAAGRARAAGFDGVEIHGAFGWVLTQFLSPTLNRRTDRYGGNLQNRSRLLFEIADGIREIGGPDFQIGLRLSMERFGLRLAELRQVAAEFMRTGRIDYLDLAPWDVTKAATEPGFEGGTLLDAFLDLPRHGVRLGASGKVMDARRARWVLDHGCDFVMIGRAAILRSDFARQIQDDSTYDSPALPVSEAHLVRQGLSPAFVKYMHHYDGFVARDRT